MSQPGDQDSGQAPQENLKKENLLENTDPEDGDDVPKKKPLKKKKLKNPDGEPSKPADKQPMIRVRPPAVLPPMFEDELPKKSTKSAILKKPGVAHPTPKPEALQEPSIQSRILSGQNEKTDSISPMKGNQISPFPSPPKEFHHPRDQGMKIQVTAPADSEHLEFIPAQSIDSAQKQSENKDRLDTEFQPLKYTPSNLDPEHIEQVKESDLIKSILRTEGVFKLIKSEQTLQILHTKEEMLMPAEGKRSENRLLRGARGRVPTASSSNLSKVKLLSSPDTRAHLQKYLPIE